MSAIGGPDEHSHAEQYPETSQAYNSAESGVEHDANYQPEREFVLMPLFRRIGEMLGLGRNQEAEYIHEPEQARVAHQPLMRATEPEEQVVLPETAIQYSEPQLPAENPAVILSTPVLDDQGWTEEPAQEDLLQLSSDSATELADDLVHNPVESLQQEHSQVFRNQQTEHSTPEPLISEDPGDERLVTTYSGAPEMEHAWSPVEEWPIPPQLGSTPHAPSRERSLDEVRQLVAPLREAAVKITTIVAQAAEWLRTKEEEFLRSAQTIAAESKREQESLRSSSQLASSTEDATASSSLQQAERPGVQRELAWRDKIDQPAGYREVLAVPIQFVAKPDRPMTTPSIPFWKRINWAEEFTPKRVAVLGGLAMAVLLVLGISLARRPASSVLPEQQTRSLQPGGVTVTTHPVASPVSPQVLRKASANERPSPGPQHRPRRAGADDYDDEPDVVIHHYNPAKKPSPVRQTTVAGVRHYSDM